MQAARLGDSRSVQVLLHRKASTMQRNYAGCTALHLAAPAGKVDAQGTH